MNSTFKRFVLLAVAPLSIWGCQCSRPVSIDSAGEDTASTLPEQEPAPATPEAPPLGTSAPLVIPDGPGSQECVDEDGDRFGAGCELGPDCDETDPQLGADGSRSCFTGPLGAQDVGACAAGTQSCSGGVLGPCVGEVVPQAEVCDGVDNDCDGASDEAVTRSCYPDGAGTAGVGVCRSGVQTCKDGVFGACVGATTPQAETCDGLDNDCDGQLDENLARVSRQREQQSTHVVLRPVDVIFVVDNSGSMTDEIVSIQNNISVNFADLIAQSGIDYRVIFLSKHGSVSASQSICIKAPLSGNGDCSVIAACPVNTDRFFHYSTEISTHDSLAKIVATYNAPDSCGLAPGGWSQWLRPNAAKVFIEITDSEPSTGNPGQENSWDADAFEAALFGLSPAYFGDAANRGYMFHTIAGLRESSPPTAPWLPTDPLVTDRCTGNGGHVVADGLEYQKLSVRTGGLRYPICEYQSFDSVFRNVATGIIERTQLACDFELASVPPGTDLATAGLELVPGAGATVPLTRVSEAGTCTPDGFYVDGHKFVLCPGACTLWQSDASAALNVLFRCIQ